jgi:hypothetical protein
MDELPFLFSTVQGSAESRQFRLTDNTGTGVTTFTGSESLSAKLYAGDDIASSITPTLAWGTPPVVTLTIAANATSSLTAQPGYILAFTVGSVTRLMGRVTILPASASTAALSTRVSYNDLRRLDGASLEALITSTDQAGFAEQRHLARKNTDDIIQRHYRRGYERRQDTLDHLMDDFGGFYRSGSHDAELQEWLDEDGRLILTTPNGQRLKDAEAYYALHLVYSAQMTERPDDAYSAKARRYKILSGNLYAQCMAEIDTTATADGVADIVIDLSTADRLRA